MFHVYHRPAAGCGCSLEHTATRVSRSPPVHLSALSQELVVIRTRREGTDLNLAECYRRESGVTQGALTVIYSVGSDAFSHGVLDLIKDLKWFINKL